MARYMRIPQYFGQATDILYYSGDCQFNSLGYYKKFVTIDNVKAINFDGTKDYILAKFDSSTNGWFPQVGASFFMKFMIPSDAEKSLYTQNFGVFGSGDMVAYQNYDFWGLYVRKNSDTSQRQFYLTISDLNQTNELLFSGISFDAVTFEPDVWHTIALVQNSSYAELYHNGDIVSKVTFTLEPKTNQSYDKIYIGRFGATTDEGGFQGYIKEVGLWSRPIDQRDIIDLTEKNFIVNKGVLKTSKRIKIDGGKFYYNGFVHSIDSTSVFIDGVGIETVYLIIKESLVTEVEDSDLLDNSVNTYNLGKPGMHRIKFEYSYEINTDITSLDEDTTAVRFLEFEDGVKTYSLLEGSSSSLTDEQTSSSADSEPASESGGKATQVPATTEEISELLSKYAYEMLGNFIYSGLNVNMMEKDSANYQISIGAGVYYLNGKRYELDKNIFLDVSRTASLTSIVNEYITVIPDTPILLSQQPAAAYYTINGVKYSGVTRALVPVKHTREILVTRTNPNGEDMIDASAIKCIKVYKGSTIYTACSTLDGTDGDYYFYNGRIKWSPYAVNKPKTASVGVTGDSYIVEYAAYYSCTEGVDNDFILIKGDKLYTEKLKYKGKNILHNLKYNLEHLITIKAVVNGSTYVMNTDDVEIDGATLTITKDLSYLKVGATLEIYYSYNSSQSVKPNWHILFFNNGNKDILSDIEGMIDYKYYLTDMYTLVIDQENMFKLYRGIPGYRGKAVRASIPDAALPLADIVIDPDGSEYCTITSYNMYRTHVSDIRNMSNKISEIENDIILSELENSAEAKATLSKLKGMYVDSLSNYSRSDLVAIDAFIDLVRERLYSGFDSSSVNLAISNPTNLIIGKEIYFPSVSDARKVIDYQYSRTGSESINRLLISKADAQITVYNDYSYNQEADSYYTRNAINAVKLSQLTLIPYNSDVSIINSSYTDSTTATDRSSLIKRTLSKFNVFFEGMEMNAYVDERSLVFVGRGFDSNEKGISLKINGKVIDRNNISPLSVTNNGKIYVTGITENGENKSFRIQRLDLASGWNVSIDDGIIANSKGEFVIKVIVPKTLGLITGTHYAVFEREENSANPITIQINFNGILNSLKNVINTGSRGNITQYESAKYSSGYIPGVIQPISRMTATITAISLYFEHIDYTSPIIIDLYELDGTNIKNVLSRKYISTKDDFSSISNSKYTITLDSPVNIESSRLYGIGISTNNSSIRCYISEIGKLSLSSEDLNTVVSKIVPMLTVTNTSGDTFVVNTETTKGLMYEITALNNSAVIKNTSGYTEHTVRFDDLVFGSEQDRFSLSCDFDPTIGYNRKIVVEYSISATSLSDSAKTWNKILPYTLITPADKFTSLSIRFIISSGNDNYIPSLPQYPVVNVYKFLSESAYQSKTFETGIEEGSGENTAELYFNAEYRTGSDYELLVSPDAGMSWRSCTQVEHTINGTTPLLTLLSEHYRYQFKLANPVITKSELIDYDASVTDNGKFTKNMTASYFITSLDENADYGADPNEVYSLNSKGNAAAQEIIFDGDKQKVSLTVELDPNSRGFRVYRSINGSSVFYQIYNSIARSSIPSNYSVEELNNNMYIIPLNNAVEFPNSGVVKINDELIKYTSISANSLVVAGNGRGYANTTIVQIKPGDIVDLYDYGDEHEDLQNGQVPRIYSAKPTFEFVDDYDRYRDYGGRVAKDASLRADNDTHSYPASLTMKIKFTNSKNVDESSSVWDLICNIENG